MNKYLQRYKSLEQRFWEKVKIGTASECWPWLSLCVDRKGYGKLWYAGGNVYAHRMAWTLTNGPIPEGLFCLHNCDNPGCCNPGHIRLGTLKENMQDAISRDRIAKGERQGNARLTHEQVREIRVKYNPRLYGYDKLAKEYNVAKTTIRKVVDKVNWKHL